MQFGNYNINKKNKRKKIVTVILCSAAAIAAAVYVIGLIAHTGGERAEVISSAVAENIQLKEQISEMNDRIAFLEQENENLSARLALAPTPAPQESNAPQTPEPTPEQNMSPRGNRE